MSRTTKVGAARTAKIIHKGLLFFLENSGFSDKKISSILNVVPFSDKNDP